MSAGRSIPKRGDVIRVTPLPEGPLGVPSAFDVVAEVADDDSRLILLRTVRGTVYRRQLWGPLGKPKPKPMQWEKIDLPCGRIYPEHYILKTGREFSPSHKLERVSVPKTAIRVLATNLGYPANYGIYAGDLIGAGLVKHDGLRGVYAPTPLGLEAQSFYRSLPRGKNGAIQFRNKEDERKRYQ